MLCLAESFPKYFILSLGSYSLETIFYEVTVDVPLMTECAAVSVITVTTRPEVSIILFQWSP